MPFNPRLAILGHLSKRCLWETEVKKLDLDFGTFIMLLRPQSIWNCISCPKGNIHKQYASNCFPGKWVIITRNTFRKMNQDCIALYCFQSSGRGGMWEKVFKIYYSVNPSTAHRIDRARNSLHGLKCLGRYRYLRLYYFIGIKII